MTFFWTDVAKIQNERSYLLETLVKNVLESYADDVVVNWSGRARQHNVLNTVGEPAVNSGQLAIEMDEVRRFQYEKV